MPLYWIFFLSIHTNIGHEAFSLSRIFGSTKPWRHVSAVVDAQVHARLLFLGVVADSF